MANLDLGLAPLVAKTIRASRQAFASACFIPVARPYLASYCAERSTHLEVSECHKPSIVKTSIVTKGGTKKEKRREKEERKDRTCQVLRLQHSSTDPRPTSSLSNFLASQHRREHISPTLHHTFSNPVMANWQNFVGENVTSQGGPGCKVPPIGSKRHTLFGLTKAESN